ncbi:ribosomal oxygenase 1 [Coccinella septempunctata]|uniref:ribosomal oxygenase 1 n=1 Tax=Coccinella septempunctata TaxID=41139 RepID=UPI001D0743A7|nr:ribosomal oxygenase 1 [Coccinella septempunctata]
MKPTEGLSAFAVYKKMLAQKPSESANKLRKLKSKNGKKLKGLNAKKILLGIENNDINIKTTKSAITESKSESSTKCKHKSIRKDKDSPDSEKTQKKRKKVKRNGSNSDSPSINVTENSSSDEIKSMREDADGKIELNDPIKDGLQLFEWLISPVSPKEFFKTYWETEPLYIGRMNKKYHSHLLSSVNLDTMLRENNLYYTRNIDVVVYQNEEKEVLNPEGKATPSALWDFYSNGCSIRVLNPQTYNKKIHIMLSTLQEYFGSMVGANVYLTPPGSQGFAPHFDDIEAFVLQIEGRKHWKLYYPKDEDVLTRYSSKNFKHDELGEPFLEVSLEAGSMLYFPRGIIHEGWTDSDTHSLHITVSVYQNNAYVDLLEKALPHALAKAARSDVEFRKGLPLHFLRSDKAKKIMRKKVTNLMEKLQEYLDIEDGIVELGRKLVYDSMPPALSSEELVGSSIQGGDLLDNGLVYNKVEFDLNNKIRLTRYHCIQLEHKGENVKLYYSTENSKVYHGEEEQWLELEKPMVPVIKYLQKTFPNFVEIKDLPLEDVELKIQFVYDLWEKGILITTA